MLCEIEDAGLLREAAERKQDEKILIDIRGRDCAAIEVRYHKNCYMYYTNFLVRKEKPMENQQSRNLYQKGYQKFRKEVVAKKQIKYMTELFNQLVQTVEEEEGIDASSFRTFRLKQRLSKSYPQLVFITPKVRNNIEILENLPGRCY